MPSSQLIRVSAADAADIHANIGLRGRVGVVGNARSSVPDVVTSLGNSINDPANANKDRVDDETSREDGNSPAVAKRKSASSPNRKIGVDIPDASDAVARRQSPDYKRQNTERTSAAAAVDETNLNQLDDMHQYREALLVAKQLIRDGILTSGPASTRRKDVNASVAGGVEAAPAEEAAVIAGPPRRIAGGRVPSDSKKRKLRECLVEDCPNHSLCRIPYMVKRGEPSIVDGDHENNQGSDVVNTWATMAVQNIRTVNDSDESNNLNNGDNMGESGEGTKAEVVVAAGEKGCDAPKSTTTDSQTTKIAPWESRFEELRWDKDANGHTHVPQSYDSLGLFVKNQRSYCKLLLEGNPAYGMTQERAEALGFKGWAQRNWGDRIKELEEYKANHGHLNVPRSHGSLGTFVNDQRRNHKLLLEGKPANGMTQERANQLEVLGLKWSRNTTRQSWDDRMEKLREFKKEYGHLNVPRSHCFLGQFVHNQRNLHKLLLKGKPALGMTQERAKELEALGFKW